MVNIARNDDKRYQITSSPRRQHFDAESHHVIARELRDKEIQMMLRGLRKYREDHSFLSERSNDRFSVFFPNISANVIVSSRTSRTILHYGRISRNASPPRFCFYQAATIDCLASRCRRFNRLRATRRRYTRWFANAAKFPSRDTPIYRPKGSSWLPLAECHSKGLLVSLT